MLPLTIGKLSKSTGVKVTTIRYYESVGLLGTPERSASGQRRYGEGTVQRLTFIRHARDLGFSMDDIRQLIDLQTNPGRDCSAVDAIARHHLNEVRTRLSQLEALEAELKRMISGCEGGTVGSCHVMTALNNHSGCISDHH